MTNENELLFFLSCTTDRREIPRCINENGIVSIYHVCGVDPWLIILKSNIQDATELNSLYQLNIKYMSVAPTVYWRIESEVSNRENKILSWIFIKGSQASSFIDEITARSDPKYKITEAYKLFGEDHFIVKFYTSNINGVDSFLALCRERGMTTSTKFVLSAIKEDNRIIPPNIHEKRERAMQVKREVDYAVARIMANERGFVYQDKIRQELILTDRLREMGIPFAEGDIKNLILDPSTTEDEYSQYDLEHPNRLIDRYSIKLERGNWLKTLFFFKANPRHKDKLENVLQEDLLGVHPSQFSRKLYHITGDYDFMIPFDCADIEALNRAIDDFIRVNGKLVTNFINTVCRPIGGRGVGPLNPLDIPFIESLLINATQMSQFEKNIRDRDIFSSILSGKELILAEEGIAPREDYVRNKIKNENIRSIKDYLGRFRSFEDIGIEPTIEFRDGALIQTLLKFYLTDLSSKMSFLQKISEKTSKYEIISTVYEPVRDPLTVMCILMIKDLVELEVIFAELGRYCRKIEFHIIFHQRYYSKVIEYNIGCKPCFHPFEPKEDCKRDCDDCWEKQKKECTKQKCGNCIRYILPRKRNRRLKIDFEQKIQQKIKIALVGIDMSLSQYLALEKLLDQESRRKEIFDNYGEIIGKKPEGIFYTSHEKVLEEYERIVVDRDGYRKRYKEAIIDVLNHILGFNPDIIIFPEYTIPLHVYNEIRRYNIKNECIIVAGSHIDDKKFNVSPIIFNKAEEKKKIYYYYKNNFSPFEEELGLIKNKGTAYLKFLDTTVGNLYIQVCYDYTFALLIYIAHTYF